MKNLRYILFAFVLPIASYADTASDIAALEALGELTEAPAMYEVDSSGGSLQSSQTLANVFPSPTEQTLTAIFFDSVDYQGSPTRVYGWVGLPPWDAQTDAPLPAVVLVHGGGGTAEAEWANLWAERGYVAISIDTEGRASNEDRSKSAHSMSGPRRTGVFNESDVPIGDQFMFHATAGSILANSLLRSWAFVDDTKVGIHGISWGGLITSTAIGIDTRFAFAIPSYGCGHMWDGIGKWQENIADAGGTEYYKNIWDSMLRLQNATMPIMWLSWPQENNFNIDSQANSYNQSPGTRMVSLVPGMGHSQVRTWRRADSYDFADSIVGHNSGSVGVSPGNPWCIQKSLNLVGDQITVEFESTKILTGASLFYTNEMGSTTFMAWPEVGVDSFAETAPGSGIWRITATLPADANGWYVNVTADTSILQTAYLTGRTNYISGTIHASTRLQEVVEVQPPAPVQLELSAGGSSVTGSATVDFTAIHNLEITSVEFINESHPGAFSSSEEFTFGLITNTPFDVSFNNSTAGLSEGQSASATLRLTWVALDNVTFSTIDIPLVATVRAPQEVVFEADANWSSQATSSIDGVVIRDGATVRLDEHASIPSLTLGQAATAGFLNLEQPFDLFVSEHLSLSPESRITLSSGSLEFDQTAFKLDGEIHVAGGELRLRGSDVTGRGKLKITAGELNFLAARRIDIAEIEISGGALDFVEGGSNAQTFLGANGVSALTIIGRSPVVTVGRLNLQPTTSVSPMIRFVLDELGVSPIQVSAFMNLPQLEIRVDATAYAGGTGELVLLQASNFATLGDTNNYAVSGFADKGLKATFVQDQDLNLVKLVITKSAYGTWADSHSLPANAYLPHQDPDGDGLENLVEFVLGFNPLSGEPDPFSFDLETIDRPIFEYSRTKISNGETTQVFQYSDNLVAWTDIAIDDSLPEVSISNGESGMETVVISLNTIQTTEDHNFGRLFVGLLE